MAGERPYYRTGADTAIGSAVCPKDNVYFVGPFGRRVSFASQQQRALDLIWALRKKGQLKEGEHLSIGVVGGGIAGVTTAAALLCLEYEVHLIEREGDVLQLQQGANHRLVHPTINFWPEEALEWTTRLPFLDWYADDSVAAVRAIAKDWLGFTDRFGAHSGICDRLTRLIDSKGVDRLRRKGKKVAVLSKGVELGAFDRVFVTTGFGVEHDLGDREQRAYWKQDELDTFALRRDFQIAVSGTGDGGIIDILRATYPGFMRNEIALKLIHIEETNVLRKRISEIEEKAIGLSDDPDALSLYYSQEYGKIASGLSVRARSLLPAPRDGKVRPILIGENSEPFDFSVAPIHKLILAYTLGEGRISYRRGRLVRVRGRWMIEEPGGTRSPAGCDHLVVRHGAKAPAAALIGRRAAESMRRIQRMLGDFEPEDRRQIAKAYANERVYPARGSLGFVKRRFGLGREFVSKRFGVGLALDVVNLEFQAEPVGEEPRNLNQLPNHLFGITFRNGLAPIRDVDALLEEE